MRKNIIITILAIVSLCSMVYAFTQKIYGIRQEKMAIANAQIAFDEREKADQAIKQAEQMLIQCKIEAELQRKIAEEATSKRKATK